MVGGAGETQETVEVMHVREDAVAEELLQVPDGVVGLLVAGGREQGQGPSARARASSHASLAFFFANGASRRATHEDERQRSRDARVRVRVPRSTCTSSGTLPSPAKMELYTVSTSATRAYAWTMAHTAVSGEAFAFGSASFAPTLSRWTFFRPKRARTFLVASLPQSRRPPSFRASASRDVRCVCPRTGGQRRRVHKSDALVLANTRGSRHFQTGGHTKSSSSLSGYGRTHGCRFRARVTPRRAPMQPLADLETVEHRAVATPIGRAIPADDSCFVRDGHLQRTSSPRGGTRALGAVHGPRDRGPPGVRHLASTRFASTVASSTSSTRGSTSARRSTSRITAGPSSASGSITCLGIPSAAPWAPPSIPACRSPPSRSGSR